MKALIYVRNDFSELSMRALKPLFSQKVVPYHLEELRLVNCGRVKGAVLAEMLEAMAEKSYIRKLSLVAMQIEDEVVLRKLTKFVKN